MRETLKYYFSAVIASYGEIFFLRDSRYGLLLLLISFFNVNIAFSGLIAIVTVLVFAAFIRMEKAFLENGFYIYNPLLVGMSVGYLFQVTMVSSLLILMASIFTFLLTMVLYRIFSKASVPILSLPFTMISTLIYLATLNYTSLYTQALYVQSEIIDLSFLPLAVSMWLKAYGTVLFLPYSSIGFLFALLLLCYSRVIFLFSLAGFYAGVFVHSLMLGSYEAALLNPYTFNYILISIALGTVFVVPSIRSIVLALVGVSISVLLIDASSSFWTIYKIPVFALPFNLITIFFLFVLKSVQFKEFVYYIRKTPEMTLRSYVLSMFRFKTGEINLFLPFTGTWNVYQGIDDEWTHKGEWKYAYDFVIYKEGKSFKNEGRGLEDYYAFKKPVLSPVSGYVVDLKESIEDNAIGQTNTLQNWGNFIVIQTAFGNYIEISHFSKHSLKVKKGDFVEPGQILGLCGNSGYSPQPHIHIQVQESMMLGSRTLPFNFVSYIQDKHVCFYMYPLKNEEVEACFSDEALDKKLSFNLESEYIYDVYEGTDIIDTLHITVKMDRFSGRFYFQDTKGNRLHFEKEAGMFYFYDYEGKDNSWLQKMYTATPRIPLCYQKGLSWNDFLPVGYVNKSFYINMFSLGTIFFPRLFVTKGEWRFKAPLLIEGKLFSNPEQNVYVELDEVNGILMIAMDTFTMRIQS